MDSVAGALLRARMEAVLNAVVRIGGKTFPLRVDPPAAPDKVFAVEQQLGTPLPSALRDAFLTFSSHVECIWFLPEERQRPNDFWEVFGGYCFWALEWMIDLETERRGWIDTCFPDRANPYDAVWHDKLVFQSVGNGDCLALDIAAGAKQEVVYLSHDDGEGHGLRLGANFQDFLLRWSGLGFAGAEDWQLMPFMPRGGYLDPDCDTAQKFKAYLTSSF